MARDLAIDLGSANTLVYRLGEGIVYNEPSVVAMRAGRVIEIGNAAWGAIDRSPGNVQASRPLRTGTVHDFEVTQQMLRVIFQRVGVSRFPKPNVLICSPSTSTQVERRALEEAGRHAGARRVVLVEEPLAAAIGARLPVHEPVGNLIVDIGGGMSEMAVVSMGGVVDGRAIGVGGFDLDAAIQAYVRQVSGVVIGDKTAERIKMAIGSAYPTAGGTRVVRVRGREADTGGPRDLELTENEIREAMSGPVSEIVAAARDTLAEAPPELTHDVLETGMFLTGGGGMLRGMAMLLSRECEVPVHLTEHPLDTVVMGAGILLEDLPSYRSTLQLQRTNR